MEQQQAPATQLPTRSRLFSGGCKPKHQLALQGAESGVEAAESAVFCCSWAASWHRLSATLPAVAAASRGAPTPGKGAGSSRQVGNQALPYIMHDLLRHARRGALTCMRSGCCHGHCMNAVSDLQPSRQAVAQMTCTVLLCTAALRVRLAHACILHMWLVSLLHMTKQMLSRLLMWSLSVRWTSQRLMIIFRSPTVNNM